MGFRSRAGQGASALLTHRADIRIHPGMIRRSAAPWGIAHATCPSFTCSLTLLSMRNPGQHLQHSFAQEISDEEVAFGIAKPMVSMPRVRGELFGAGTAAGDDKESVDDA